MNAPQSSAQKHSLAGDVLATAVGTLFVSFGNVMFRHQASLGGVDILTLYVQDRYGIRAGKLQMAVDLAILLASCFVVDVKALLASVIGVVA